MLVGDLKSLWLVFLKGGESLVTGHSENVRITTMGEKHHSNSLIKTEKHHTKHRLKLGSYVSIGIGCTFFLSGNHDWKRTTTYLNPFKESDTDGLLTNGDINIGHDVWIGEDVTVMSGISIGNGAVIAAGSIVSRDIEPYTIAGGIPCKPIKKRFDEKTIERLLKSEWWNLPEEELKQYSEFLFSRNVEDFLNKIETNNNSLI